MGPFTNIYTEIVFLLLLATTLGTLAIRLRQPLLIAFIVVGIVVGPSALNWVSANDQVDLLARLGITLLLFIVGLKLDVHIIRSIGPVALATGIGQVAFTTTFGYLIATALGMPTIPSLYVAIAAAFSSTIIIIKLLSDKKEIETLHGRVALGFLIVQDIIVVLVLIGLNTLSHANQLSLSDISLSLLSAVLFFFAVFLLTRYLLLRLFHFLSRSPELLVLFSIAWAAALADVSAWLGFSKELGAFVGGVSLASTPYKDIIGSRLASLRDFLLLFFFIDLGSRMNLNILGTQFIHALIFSALVLIGNPLIVMTIMGLLGYRKRTSFFAGLTVAQISEFSLILALVGLSFGHITGDTIGLITLMALITMSCSTYMIVYSHQLYKKLAPLLTLFERKRPHREDEQKIALKEKTPDIVIFGMGTYGSEVAHVLREKGQTVLGIDFSPERVRHGDSKGHPILYGDAEDAEFIASLSLEKTKWVVCTVRQHHIKKLLIQILKNIGYSEKIAVRSSEENEAANLKTFGVDLVLIPSVAAALETATQLSIHNPLSAQSNL